MPRKETPLSRIPLLPEDGLSPVQQVVYDKITSGPRGAVVGPLRAALHSPELADRWQALGEFLRYRTSLHPRFSELAIIVCGRHWSSDVEWYVHVEAGLRAGLSEAVINAIRSMKTPVFDNREEAVVYEFARELLQRGRVSDPTYQSALQMFETIGVVELTALVGYYTMVAMTLNAHHVPMPDANPSKLQTLDAATNAEGEGLSLLPAAPPRIAAPTSGEA